ncbi:Casein kinase II subunit beta [Tritrichomonas foetus]|uniref:Casein kinase II subunit beta n=1 Tax=Tritrichomonas foetus TaxID=1144522 RepID=A0A1J4KSK8_9EUKA|nr:Casein kinase II subunit beta [Tritrichomonas foetus]|eukprot:OHT14090.1 Casein kinase II subunit beta [Tritrichomonas foetus]
MIPTIIPNQTISSNSLKRLPKYSPKTWIDWIFTLSQSKYFIKIDNIFIKDQFNHTGIATHVQRYQEVRRLILGYRFTPKGIIRKNSDSTNNSVIMLNGLLHARFINTKKGLHKMHEKFSKNEFPKCPRYKCHGASCLPFGMYDEPGKGNVCFYCPKCQNIYECLDEDVSGLDGAFFGPTWINMFMFCYSLGFNLNCYHKGLINNENNKDEENESHNG